MNEGLVFNEALGKYVMVGISAQEDETPLVWGVYYSLSEDLIHWSTRKLLLETESGEAVVDPANELLHAYPSVIDHDGASKSFETADEAAYLYISRFNLGGNSLDRDLLRFPIAAGDVLYTGPEGTVRGWCRCRPPAGNVSASPASINTGSHHSPTRTRPHCLVSKPRPCSKTSA